MSNNLSKIIVQGNLTRDAELKISVNGVSVTTFSVAVNCEWKNKAGEKQKETQALRDQFAMAALTGYLSNPNNDESLKPLDWAHDAYMMADAMLKVREK